MKERIHCVVRPKIFYNWRENIKASIGRGIIRGFLFWDGFTHGDWGIKKVKAGLANFLKKKFPFMSDEELDELVELNMPTIFQEMGLKESSPEWRI